MSSTFFIPAVNIMGIDCLDEAMSAIVGYGFAKALIVTDAGLAKAGVAQRIAEQLAVRDIDSVVFDGAKPNPSIGNVEQGLALLQRERCDFVLSLGGGSPHDCAKGIALCATNGGHISDYEGVDRSAKPQLPLIAINTTAGTASEMTRFCIITDETRHVKMAIVDRNVTPLLSVNDPALMIAMPKSLTAATGMDALTHAIEAYTGKPANPISDGLALHAIRLIAQHLKPAVQEPDNREAREQMLIASLIAGMAFGNADIASVHCISEAIGGMYDTPHGVGNAIFLPFVFSHNRDADLRRHADVAYALGIDPNLGASAAADAAVEQLFRMNRELGIPRFAEVAGVREEDFLAIAQKSKSNISDASNTKAMTVESYLDVIRAAYDYAA